MNNIPSLVYGHAGIPLINPLDKNIIPFSNIDEKQHAPFGLKKKSSPEQYNQLGSADKSYGGYNCYKNKAFYCMCVELTKNKNDQKKCHKIKTEANQNKCGAQLCNWIVFK